MPGGFFDKDYTMNAPIVYVRYVRLPVFEAISGYTSKSVQRKIEDGVWLEGREFRRAPDGHILVDLEGYARWVEGLRVAA